MWKESIADQSEGCTGIHLKDLITVTNILIQNSQQYARNSDQAPP